MIFRSRRRSDAPTAVAERPPAPSDDPDRLLEQVDQLADENRARRDPQLERRMVMLRHQAGIRIPDHPSATPRHPDPAVEQLPNGSPLRAVERSQLTPELLRAGILTQGCLLVRGLVDRDWALAMAADIDRAFEARTAFRSGVRPAEGYYEEFEPEPPHGGLDAQRPWIEEGGGLWAADSPKVMFAMLEGLGRVRLKDLIEGYLGEPALMSVQKTTLRKADPAVAGAWHQDGAFMGEVRSLNLWLSLSRCGDEAPGLDIVPRRLDRFVGAGGEDTFLAFQVSQAAAEEAAGDTGILRPIFEPGDALLFDDLFLHQTGSDPQMPNPRYAIESWFFGKSGFPSDYAPLAL